MVCSQKLIAGFLSGLISTTSTLGLLENKNEILVVAQTVSQGFVTPSGNIYCALVGEDKKTLRCEIGSRLNPKPPQPYPGYCKFDWGAGFTFPNDSRPEILCISDTIAGGDYPTLSYGSTWGNAGFRCVSQRTGLTCTNSINEGFFLSRERWRVFTVER